MNTTEWNASPHLAVFVARLNPFYGCFIHGCPLKEETKCFLMDLVHGPLARYVKLWVANAPGMSGTFSLPPRVSDLDMHHGTCITHMPWCMPGSLTVGFFWSRFRGKHSRHSRRMCNPQFYLSGKRPILYGYGPSLTQWKNNSMQGKHQKKKYEIILNVLPWILFTSTIWKWQCIFQVIFISQ